MLMESVASIGAGVPVCCISATVVIIGTDYRADIMLVKPTISGTFLNELQVQREASGNPGPLLAVGYSLGGNVLLKYLGESKSETPLAAATAVSVPLDLHVCAEALILVFQSVTSHYLLKRMKSAVARKFDKHTAAFDWDRAMNSKTFAEFDDSVTAPLHGFRWQAGLLRPM